MYITCRIKLHVIHSSGGDKEMRRKPVCRTPFFLVHVERTVCIKKGNLFCSVSIFLNRNVAERAKMKHLHKKTKNHEKTFHS